MALSTFSFGCLLTCAVPYQLFTTSFRNRTNYHAQRAHLANDASCLADARGTLSRTLQRHAGRPRRGHACDHGGRYKGHARGRRQRHKGQRESGRANHLLREKKRIKCTGLSGCCVKLPCLRCQLMCRPAVLLAPSPGPPDIL